MRVNKWTLGLAACGLVSLPALIHAEEKMSSVNTALSSTTISGYVNTSAHWNPGSGNGNIPGYAYNAGKQDGFNLDVVKVSIERPLDESQWSAGYKADLLFGPDATAGGVGLGTQSSAEGDVALKQAYVALRAPIGTGLDLKLGVFDTIVGYETFDAGSNPNYTRSYGYTFEPTTHTGLLATYQFGEMIGVSAGIANTYGPRINERAFGDNGRAESYKTYMASVAFSAPKDWGFLGGSTLYFGMIKGLNSGYANTANANVGARTDHYYLGGAINTPVTGLKLGASYDYVFVDDRGATADQYAWAAALYASFAPKDTKFGFHLRAEVAAHSDGILSSAGVVGPAPAPGPAGAADVAAFSTSDQDAVIPTQVFALTGTVQYDLWKNVLTRLEARWDHALSDDNPNGGGSVWGNDSNGAATRRNNFLIAANVIYKF